MNRRRTAACAALAAAALLAACGGNSASPVESAPAGLYRGSEPPGGIELPRFVLHDERGELVDSRDLRGKVVLVTFLDSQCTESCPLIASEVARTLDGLSAAERRQLEAVAISTDPAEDTRPAVRSFLRRRRALGRLRYLGGGEPLSRLRGIWRAFQILPSVETGKDALHSAPVRLYDRDGFWVATLHPGADLTIANLAHDLRLALRR